MRTRKLIVNADDYNSDRERNRGIREAAEKGIVTSVSVIANLPFEKESIEGLKSTFGPRVGIHLNLTKGKPLTYPATTLVDEKGHFFKKRIAWRRALLKQYNIKEVEAEFRAQIYHLQTLGITPHHLDGNNHLHIFPGIAEVVVRIARDFNIRKIRLPWEKLQSASEFLQPRIFKKLFFGLLARKAYSRFKSSGLIFPENFFGIQFPRVSEIGSLKKFFRILPAGTTELMCHPGYRNQSLPTDQGSYYEKELSTLVHPEVIEEINRQKIALISYIDL